MLVQQRGVGGVEIRGIGPTKYQSKIVQWQRAKEVTRAVLAIACIIAFWLYVWCVTP